MSEVKLSDNQKEVIKLMRKCYFLYENRITPGARWSLGKFKDRYQWGNVNGNVINKLVKANLIEGTRYNTACWAYSLTTLGKTIQI